jgi:hypothetical protein
MEIEIKRAPRGLLKDDVPYHEEWRGELGRTRITERLFVCAHEGSVEEIELVPDYKIGANYAYSPVEEGKGQTYYESIINAGFDPELKTNSFLILQREYKNWNNSEFVDKVTIIVIDD